MAEYRNKHIYKGNPFTAVFDTDPHNEGVDLTGAELKIKYLKPGETEWVTVTATRRGTTKYIYYRVTGAINNASGKMKLYSSIKFQGDSEFTDSYPTIEKMIEEKI